jgi:hypothetical protein
MNPKVLHLGLQHISLCLEQFNQQTYFGHKPRDLSHFKCYSRDRAAKEHRALPGKVGDGIVYIRHLVANMIGPSAFLQGAINWRIWPQGSYQFKDCVIFSTAEEAD